MTETIWVAIITASPTLVIAFFTSYFQYKINKSNSDKLDKYNALKDFNEYASKYYSKELISPKIKYEVSLNNLLIYFPKANIKFIKELEKARNLRNWNEYYPVLQKTIKYLSSLI